MDNNQPFHPLKEFFLRQIQLAQKQANGIDFVIRAKDDLTSVQEEIRKSKKNACANGDEELEQVYQRRLQEGLDYFQEKLLERGYLPEQIIGNFHKLAIPYDARGDAFQFVLDSDFDQGLIAEEIRFCEDLIAKPLEPRMHPGATPGMYRRCYLEYLKEIVSLLS